MRRSVVLVILLSLGAPAQAGTRCDAPRPHGPLGLPDTIFAKGACGTFALRPDGRVTAVHPSGWAPSWAKGANARADERTYITHPRRHLVLLRDAKTLWRSRLAHGSDDVVVHGDAIAFTAYEQRPAPDLWVAHFGHAERLIARGEDLDGWARAGGFFTQRGRELRLRDVGGRLIRRLASVSSTAYDASTQTLVAITTAHLVVRTDGRSTTRLADLAKLGLRGDVWLATLPRQLVLVQADKRLLVLRRDGSWFASTALARLVSPVTLLPDGRGVVYVTHSGREDRVLLLERGHHAPRRLDAQRAGPLGCGYGVGIALAGDELLYWPSTGRALVAVDTTGRRPPVDLWPFVHRIPGFRGHGRIYRAAWASGWNR